MGTYINGLSVKLEGNPENQPIVFIHGFPFDKKIWRNQIRLFRDNYYCVSYDIRGLGKSYVGDGQYTIEAFVDDLYSIISELNLEKPVLCGHSMGGYISLRTLEQNRIEFGGAILCNTKSDADTDLAKIVRAAKINQINVEGMDAFAREFVKGCFSEEYPEQQKDNYYEVLNRARNSDATGVKGCLLALAARTSTTEFLSELNIPVLVIAGPFDNFMPAPVLREMSEKIKDADFAVVPQSGHMSAIENPGCVNDLIKNFLGNRIK